MVVRTLVSRLGMILGKEIKATEIRTKVTKATAAEELQVQGYRSQIYLTLSSRGLGHHPFTVSTGVRIPVGSPSL